MEEKMTPRSLTSRLLVLTLVLTSFSPACAAQRRSDAVTVPPPPSKEVYEQEIKIGREVSAEADKQLPILPQNHPVSQYVEQLGQRIAAQTPEPRYPYVFKVVNQKEINAFALPGGPVYLHVGIIQAADNEAEVAGVLGHEIAHVVMRHGTQRQSNPGNILGALSQIGGAILGGTAGGLIQLAGGLGGGLWGLKYSREAEREADQVGARLLHESNYNPQAMVTFFRKLQEQGGRGGPEWLSSHPDPGNRAQLVSEAIAGLPAKNYRSSTASFQQAKQEVGKLNPLSAEEVAKQQKQQQPAGGIQQVSRQEVMPSGQFQSLQHGAFRIEYPSNWQVVGDQQSTVAIAPRAGVSGNQIAYGAMVAGYAPQGRVSLDRATRDIVQGLQQGNPGLRTVGSARRIRVNGMDARSVELLGQSPVQGQRERDWLVVLPRRSGGFLYAIFISPENDFTQLRPTFEHMLRTLYVN